MARATEARTGTLLKQTEVLGGYDPTAYASERVFATAADGTRIPVSLVYRKGIRRDGSAPALLYAYGSYGSSTDPTFNSGRLSLLDRGFVYAIAHIRGGGDLGKPWHEATIPRPLTSHRHTRSSFMPTSTLALFLAPLLTVAPILADESLPKNALARFGTGRQPAHLIEAAFQQQHLEAHLFMQGDATRIG